MRAQYFPVCDTLTRQALENAAAVCSGADGRAGRAVPADGDDVHAAAGASGQISAPRSAHPRSTATTAQDGGGAHAAPPRPAESAAAADHRWRNRGPRPAAGGRRSAVQRTPAFLHPFKSTPRLYKHAVYFSHFVRCIVCTFLFSMHLFGAM
jgi:hypothetical protein